MKLRMWREAIAAGLIAATVLYGGAAVAAETTGTDSVKTRATDLLDEIPIGPADENKRTSAAITQILMHSADAYKNTDAMSATGTYIYVSKEDDGETSHVTTKVTMNFLRPNRMSVVCKSDTDFMDCSFIANGTTSTHISASDAAYVQLTQPDLLAAYAENYRAGEIFDEYSGALALSVTGPVLVSDDPQAWLFADVSRFVYEGREDVNGAMCHRVRFIQENPDVIVILWVNEKTWLIDKTSFINSYDEDYNLVESFEEGETATMSIMTWDNQTTDPDAVDTKAFKAKIPKDFEQLEDTKPANAGADDGEGFWGSLVGVAAKSSPEETTWSLTKVTGELDLTLKRFAKVNPPLVEFDILPESAGDEPRMAVASEDGTVKFLRGDGSVESTVKLEGPLGLLSTVTTETSETLFVTADKAMWAVTAFDLEGKKLWSYRHPFSEIKQVVTDWPAGSGIYVGYDGDNGIRKLSTDGEVLWATTKVNPQSLLVMPFETNRLAGRTDGDVYVLNRNLGLLEMFSTEEAVSGIRWDESNPSFPMLCLSYSKDRDVLLQRRSERAEIAWTTIVEPKAKDISGAGMLLADLPVDGMVTKCAVVLMSDGSVMILTTDGDTLYRGKVSANAALIKQNNDSVVQRLTIADMDGDGADEIYTQMHDNLMQVTVGTAR